MGDQSSERLDSLNAKELLPGGDPAPRGRACVQGTQRVCGTSTAEASWLSTGRYHFRGPAGAPEESLVSAFGKCPLLERDRQEQHCLKNWVGVARKVVFRMITGTPFERLFLGGIRDAIGLSASNKLQIKTVINVSMEKAEPRGEGIIYVQTPLPDGEPVAPWILERILTAIARHIRTGRLLLHCGAGMSRSVAIASLYLHVVGYANYGEALAAIATVREVDISPAMQRSVERYLENLASKGSNENSHSRRSSG